MIPETGPLRARRWKLMSLRFTALLFVALPLCAQDQPKPKADLIPLPIINPKSLKPGTLPDPMTAEEKAARTVRNTLGWRALANRAFFAGFDQLRDNPEEWPGTIEGYGMRFGDRMGRLGIRNTIMLASDVAFKIEPRYDRCDCAGVKSRTLHAWKRVVIARKDKGGETLGISRLAGAYVTPVITDQWYPDRLNTTGRKLTNGTSYLGWYGLGNMVREFWPEIQRSVPFLRNRNYE